MTNDLHAGKRYIVTRGSDDGTFEVGDHISVNEDGSINCSEAGGWIDQCDCEDATEGMEVQIDEDWRARRVQRLRDELAGLEDIQ